MLQMMTNKGVVEIGNDDATSYVDDTCERASVLMQDPINIRSYEDDNNNEIRIIILTVAHSFPRSTNVSVYVRCLTFVQFVCVVNVVTSSIERASESVALVLVKAPARTNERTARSIP